MSSRRTNIIFPNRVESFINRDLDLTETVLRVNWDGGEETTFTVENMLHIREGIDVYVGSTEVRKTVLRYDDTARTFVVEDLTGDLENAKFIRVETPFFFHGTPAATASQIARLQDSSKVPMIYLMEVVNERGEQYGIGLRASMRLFFLDVANHEDWTTDQHYSSVIDRMRRLMSRFLDNLGDNVIYFPELYGFTLTNHVKFGVYRNNQGHIKSLFNDRLSGCEALADVHAVPCDSAFILPSGAFSAAFSDSFDI